jgi:hypothetical protein
VSIRAEHVEPLVFGMVAQRLADEDVAAKILRKPEFDPAEAERLQAETAVLMASIAAANTEYDDGLIDGQRLAGRTARAKEKLAAIEAQQQDAERVRVLDGLPIGTPEVATALNKLLERSPDRYRAVVNLVVRITVMPIGKQGNTFKRDRLQPTYLVP